MILEPSSGKSIRRPTDEQIRATLEQLARNGDGFAILGPDDMTYLQVACAAGGRFAMEYQEGDTDRHFRARREDFTLDEAVRALSKYRDEVILWADFGQWDKLDI